MNKFMGRPRIVVFDSGLGGLTVLRALREHIPGARYIYLADEAGFPYGDWTERKLVARIVDVIGREIERSEPDLVVIACNTASTLALPALRNRFDIPFVGTVPAIKPAAQRTKTGVFAVLATPGTIERDYTRALIDTYAFHRHVVLVPAKRLAALADDHLKGKPPGDEAVFREIRPAFVTRHGRKTDVVTLSCTHYPLLIDVFRRISPWPVTWIDPADAIARRAKTLMEEHNIRYHSNPTAIPGVWRSTSDAAPDVTLQRALSAYGLETVEETNSV